MVMQAAQLARGLDAVLPGELYVDEGEIQLPLRRAAQRLRHVARLRQAERRQDRAKPVAQGETHIVVFLDQQDVGGAHSGQWILTSWTVLCSRGRRTKSVGPGPTTGY